MKNKIIFVVGLAWLSGCITAGDATRQAQSAYLLGRIEGYNKAVKTYRSTRECPEATPTPAPSPSFNIQPLDFYNK